MITAADDDDDDDDVTGDLDDDRVDDFIGMYEVITLSTK